MKKKRDENRKYGNKRGSTGTSSDGGGGTADNDSGIGSAPRKDDHHNFQTPCGNLPKEIAREIFPSLRLLGAAAANDTSNNNNNEKIEMSPEEKWDNRKKNADVIANGGGGGRDELDAIMESFGAIPRKSDAENKNKKKEEEEQQAEEQEPKEQPLLGSMVQQRLISERKRIRAEHGIVGGTGANGGGNNESSNSKKKKKKKRKKKGGQAGVATTDAAGDSGGAGASAEGSTPDGDEDGETIRGGENGCTTASATNSKAPTMPANENGAPPPTLEQNGSAKSNELQTTTSTDGPDDNTPTQGHDTGTENETPTVPSGSGLDLFLDSIIESTEVSNAIENRDLDSFSTFLSRKFESYRQQQQQQPKDKPKGMNRKGSKEAITTKQGDSQEFTPSMEFRDVLPTISLNEVRKHVEQITCRQCRTTATNYMRSMAVYNASSENGNNSNGKNGIGGAKNGKKPVNALNGIGSTNGKKLSPELKLVLSSAYEETKPDFSSHSNGGGLSIPITDRYHENVERAFDYVALEDADVDLEAGQPSEKESGQDVTKESSAFRLELYPTNDDYRSLQLTPLRQNGTADERTGLEFPINSDGIINLLKEFILPCGMEQARLPYKHNTTSPSDPPQPTMSDKDFDLVSTRAKELLKTLQIQFVPSEALVKEFRDKLEEIKQPNNRSFFDSTTATLLHQVDQECDASLISLGNALLKFTKMCCFVGWSSEYGPYLMRNLMNAWEYFEKGLERIIKPIMEHRGTRVGLEGRPGVFPHAYLNAAVRSSLMETVKTKCEHVEDMHNFLKKLLLGSEYKSYYLQRPENAPSVAVISCVLHAYLDYVCSDTLSEEDTFPSEELQEELRHFVNARIELVQKTTLSSLSSQMKAKEKEMYDNVKKMDSGVFDVVAAQVMGIMGDESPIQFLRDGYDKHEAKRLACDRKERLKVAAEAYEDHSLDHVDVEILINRSHQTFMQWIHLLCMRQHKISPAKPLQMPQRLKDWMERSKGSELPESEVVNHKRKQACDGGDSSGGKRRVIGILATLLYRWLEARCSEWHAELTRDELLQSMDMEQPVPVVPESSKAPKKKKTKRKSGGLDKAKAKNDDNNLKNRSSKTTTDLQNGTAHKVKEEHAEKKPIKTTPEQTRAVDSLDVPADAETLLTTAEKESNALDSSAAENIESEKYVNSSVRDGDVFEFEKGSHETKAQSILTKKTENNNFPQHELPSRLKDGTNAEVDVEDQSEVTEWCPIVSVVDGQKVLSAEMYLVKRMNAIIGLKGYDTMPSSKKVRVIQL